MRLLRTNPLLVTIVINQHYSCILLDRRGCSALYRSEVLVLQVYTKKCQLLALLL